MHDAAREIALRLVAARRGGGQDYEIIGGRELALNDIARVLAELVQITTSVIGALAAATGISEDAAADAIERGLERYDESLGHAA